MDANMEELEKRMRIRIDMVKDMMLDRFSGVDQKLTTIEQLLKKIIESQSQTGNPPENRCNLTEKNTGGGTDSSKNQDKVKKAAIGGGDGGPSLESGPNKPLQARISSDGDDHETDYPILGPPGGLHIGDEGRQGPSHESESKKPLQATISSDGDDQETDHQILGPPGGFQLCDEGRQGISHESGPKKPLQAQISSDGDDQETDHQILGPPGGLHLGDGGRQGPSHESGPKKPLQAQISSDVDDQETDYQIHGPQGGLYFGDGSRQPLWEAGRSCGWVGLYTHHYGTYNPPGADYSFGTDFCGPAWVGLQETDFSAKNGPRFGSYEFTFKGQVVNNFVDDCPETQRDRGPEEFASKVVNTDVTGWVRKKSEYDTEKGLNYSGEKGVKTGQDGMFKEGDNKPQTQVVTKGSNKGRPKNRRRRQKVNNADVTGTKNPCTGSSGKQVVRTGQVADKADAGGEEEQTGSLASLGKKTNEKTDVLLQDSSKSDQLAKKDSDSWYKAIQNETNCIWRSAPFDKSLDWSKLVEAKVDPQHGSGAPWGKKGDNKPQAGGEEEQTGSLASLGKKTDEKTDVLLQDSSKSDQLAKKDSDSWYKAIKNETNCIWRSAPSDKSLDWSKLVEAKVDPQHGSGAPWGKKGDNKPQAQVVTEGSNEKGHEKSQKSGSWGSKEEGCGSKRKHPDSPVGGPNDGPISSGPFTAAKRRLDMFTTDEQEILSEIEPIMQSIRRILHQKGYNDGDPLSADDQTYILENVFNHHPEKAQKTGAGFGYIMVRKHMKFQGTRCFYVVSTDGHKEDFSYHKCLKNFISGKYPNKVAEFIPKFQKFLTLLFRE